MIRLASRNEHWSFWIDKNVNYLLLQVKQSDGSAGQLSGNTGHYLVQNECKEGVLKPEKMPVWILLNHPFRLNMTDVDSTQDVWCGMPKYYLFEK